MERAPKSEPSTIPADGADFASAAGFLRLKQVLALIPVSKSTWYQGVQSGRYPAPTRSLGVRITAWAVKDIHRFLSDAAENAK